MAFNIYLVDISMAVLLINGARCGFREVIACREPACALRVCRVQRAYLCTEKMCDESIHAPTKPEIAFHQVSATCGQNGRCVPSHECSASYEGSCEKMWCCKSSEYVGQPPVGDCICVSSTEFCGDDLAPYVFPILEKECVCCECENKCVALLPNKLCPTYEAPAGDCDYERSKNCCKISSGIDKVLQKHCKCAKLCPVCPKSWKKVGECKLCCLP